jgi:hypothetical protein
MSNNVLPETVLVDPDRGYREWHIREIYAPGNSSSEGQYVPNPDDSVRDWTQGILRVISVDYTTGISVLLKWTEPRDPGEITDLDLLLGAGPGYQSESYRCFLDQSVFPFTLALDGRQHIYGTAASSIKIFLGTDISANGDVISQFYDSAGNLLGENIPLELAAVLPAYGNDGVIVTPQTNVAVKVPLVGKTTRSLPDGEVVTVVAYNDIGGPISQAKMLIKNSAFIRQTDASRKYVMEIAVETPFLSPSDPHLIEYPINMPVDNLNLMGVVTYSDGQRLKMPIDGTKFTMVGLRNYVATIQGQEVPLMLSYLLSPHESAYIHTPAVNGKISVPYQARTKTSDGAYSVKLFAYPTWVDILNGYRLEYYLYNLDRQQVYRVTNLVSQAVNSAPFDPILYGVRQRINVGVNMNEVDPLFDNWRHTQMFEITLIRPGNQDIGDNWTVGFTAGQEPPYGENVKAGVTFINVNNWTLDVSCGCTTLQEWLDTVYYPTQPLYDQRTEVGPLVPNFFIVQSGNSRVELPISQWNAVITVTQGTDEGKLVYIEFLRKTINNDLQLSVAGLIAHQVQ